MGAPAIAHGEHADAEAGEGADDGGAVDGDAEVLDAEEDQGGESGDESIEFALLKHLRRMAGEEVAQGAAADRGKNAEQERGEEVQAGVLCAGAAGNGEEAEGKGVDDVHDGEGARADGAADE